jgi:hypothetical protein
MKALSILVSFVLATAIASGQTKENIISMKTGEKSLACKLTTPELQERKRTVIADLKKSLIEKVEMENGIKYKFESTDDLIDRVTSFIKTERLCCDFFDLKLSVATETGYMWLELSGPEGTKEFISEEIGF